MLPIRSNIRDMAGYVPGEQLNDPDIVKLNTNECPYPPSPRVFEAVRAALTGDRLRKYPQPLGDTFRRAAGRVLNVDPDGVLIGNGSDDILTILTRAFVPEGGLVLAPTPSYILYKSLAEIQGARFETVPFTADWQLPTAWPAGGHITFLPNPNSPSGTVVPLAEVERLAAAVAPAPLVLDEAYADFADDNGLSLLGRVPNLVVTRTLSKSYALAGIRFGFAVADPAVVRELVKVKDSYNCDVLSLAAATAAVEDQDYFRETRAKLLATRARLAAELPALGFDVTPSRANFLWCRRADRPVKPLYEELKRRKVLVRYMNYAGYDGLRITVGTEVETDRLLAELRSIL
ncbi:histidinol-phosphate transaminase [Urbifossiella limnaea]|uniref:Histidinol-phosphate aminotransferase n=1 Tax=Urbifossiella limnaea TaxID=2528023 RepID=A0A517XRN8_9BACT|nr:histidinol-phosphate transaminase [Urbifossiella limnaea]QDU20175.1 Histidinol-phosphate aminotransferase [Urbifossiella limnaea]